MVMTMKVNMVLKLKSWWRRKVEHQLDKNNKNGDEEDYNYKLNNTRHGKSVDNLAGLYINSDTENDTSK